MQRSQIMNIEEQYITDIDKLVPRPDIALTVLQMVHEDGNNALNIARTVEQDPLLTTNMLRMANSSYFGHMRKISSVHDIIVRLGMNTVKTLAITSAAAGVLNSPQQAYNIKPHILWHHSRACAIMAQIISEYAKITDTFAVYTAALLHDIGKVLLNKPLWRKRRQGRMDKKFTTLVELEQYLLDTNHARVGMALLQKWGLPEEICVAVGQHHTHDDPKKISVYANIVSLANTLTHNIGKPGNEREKIDLIGEDLFADKQIVPEVGNFRDNLTPIIQKIYEAVAEGKQLNSCA